MGMFDNVKAAYPLPGRPDWARDVFQTKDMDNELADYFIDQDGYLIREGEVQDYTGSLNFYTAHKDCSVSPGPFTGYWVEYASLFERGKLVGVVRRIFEEPGREPEVDLSMEDS